MSHATWGAPQEPRHDPPPGPPRKSHKIRNIALTVAAVFVALIVIGIATGSGDEDPARPPASEWQEGQKESGGKTKEEAAREKEKAEKEAAQQKTERADLTSFKIDDRSRYGVSLIYVEWTITNNSSKVSDYMWEWEAVDASGVRIENSTEYVDNVKPGQTVKGESPALIEDPKLMLNVTHFERNLSP